jgi:hypothetical protein
MTLATQKSALNFSKLETALPIVSGAANAAGVPFTKLLSLLGKLSDAGIDTSSSATALRNIFIDSAAKGLSYEQILDKIKNSQDKLTTANDKFGKRTSVSALVLANNIDQIKELDKTLQNATGTAGTTAARQLDTLKGSVTILGSAWEGFILSLEDGTGGFSNFLKTSVKVVTEILSLATGTAKASNELSDQESKVRRIAKTLIVLLKIIGALTAAYVAFKITMFAVKAATTAYNTAVRVITGISKAWTVVQWALNAALWANPITWIVIGIVALIAAVAALVYWWKDIVHWVQTSDSMFATLLRNALIPIRAIFHAIGVAISWVVEKFKQLVEWVKTSDSWFAQFVRGGINGLVNVFQTLGKVIGWLSDKWRELNEWIAGTRENIAKWVDENAGDLVENVFGKDARKELKIEANMTKLQKWLDTQDTKDVEVAGDVVSEISSSSNPLVDALGKNSDELAKNTSASEKEWKGRFTTSILKDANIPNRAIKTAQREIAISGMAREFKNTSIQNSIINNNQTGPSEVVTPFRRSTVSGGNQNNGGTTASNSTQQINITVFDRTGGTFGVEVEGTGVKVSTTGNS